jgi:ubiquitin-protein ligase E3 C
MLDYDDFFDGSGRRNKVNLSTNTASSSSSLLSTVKKERLAREQRRRDERAGLIIQKVWRGRRAALDTRQEIIGSLGEGSVARRAGRLVGLYKIGVGADGSKVRAALGEWVERAGRDDGLSLLYWRDGSANRTGGEPAFLEVLKEDRGYEGAIIIGILLSQVIKAVSEAPA